MRELCDKSADVLIISGDIAQAPTIKRYLLKMAQSLTVPIYFVLGNHDYYHGSISGVRSAVTRLSEESSRLHWLNVSGIVYLSRKTCLVGHDSWCDARLGDYDQSSVILNDFLLISELSGLTRKELLLRLNRLGDEAAEHFKTVLPEAIKSAEHIVVLTHVPPFLEAAWYNGQYCEPDWLPFFSCKAVGDVLTETMKKHQDKRMTVLCGHTHGGGMSRILPNLVSWTGQVSYGQPVIQEIFEWD